MLVRQTVRTSGIDGIALTKLDILDGLDPIRSASATGSTARRSTISRRRRTRKRRVEPVYEEIEGWKGSSAGARSWAELPAQAIKYVRRVEELIGAPVALLSTTPERDDTILVQNPFEG